MRPNLERIFSRSDSTAQAFLPAHFGATGTHFATKFALEASKQNIKLHFAHRMQVPEPAIVLLHAETRIHSRQHRKAALHVGVIFRPHAFHARLQKRQIIFADGRRGIPSYTFRIIPRSISPRVQFLIPNS